MGASNYYFDGKLTPIFYMDWYKEKRHLEIAEDLRNNIEIEKDYSSFMWVVEANKRYIQGLIIKAETYVMKTVGQYKDLFKQRYHFPEEKIQLWSVGL